MAEKVKGTDAMIKFNILGSLEVYCYAKSFQIDINTEYVGSSTIGDGSYKRFRPKRHSYTLTMDALFLASDTAPLNASPDFLEQQLQMVEMPFEIFYTGETGSPVSMNGRVWIQTLSFSAVPNGFVSKNVQMIGNGRLNRGTTPITMVDLELQVAASVGTASMKDVKIVDGDGNETLVYAGPLNQGSTTTVSIPSGTYHIRATLNTNQPYGLYSSDAAPGFVVNLNSIPANYVYWPLPATSPIWDFTSNRFLRWEVSDVPIA